MTETTRTAAVAGAFGLIGAVAGAMTGWSELQLAKQKLHSDLVMKALESSSPMERLESLKLLVETNFNQRPGHSKWCKAVRQSQN